MVYINNITCKVCKIPISGRSDKVFCSLKCKNEYHLELKKSIPIEIKEVDKILFRNRSILYELLGTRKTQRKMKLIDLESKGFNFYYHTHITKSKNQDVFWCYDKGWTEVSPVDVLIKSK